ncbi:MAG: creatininase family protein [Actinomycetota bacterium]|nr:creatininase family protein [Actinomycetota bacterium]
MELPTYNLGELSPVDIREYLQEKDVVMIPIASLEQHGPHLPLLTDTIQADEIARRAAHKAQVLYTPCVWMGYSPQHMYDPGAGTGTITIRPNLLLELWYDIGRSLIHHGFNKLIFVNNHGSNTKIVEPMLRRLRYDTGALVGLSRLYGERYLALIDDIMENPPEETPGWHSSELETSQVLAHDEGLVRMDRAVHQEPQRPTALPDSFVKPDGAPDVEFQGHQFFMFANDHQEFTPSGIIGNPFRATADKGERTYERYSDHLAAALKEFEGLEVDVHTRAWRAIA